MSQTMLRAMIVALTAVVLAFASLPVHEGNWFFLALTLLSLAVGGRTLAALDERSSGSDISVSVAWPLLAGALIAGAILRLYGINFGLPHPYHPDEFRKINTLSKMLGRGDLDPERYFLHPPLLLYCSYFMTKVVALTTELTPRSTEALLLAGRLVSCMAGVISIGLVYLIGSEVWNRRSGAIAAWGLAVFPMHVTCSRYMKEDVLFTAFLLGSTWALARYNRTRSLSDLLVAGALVGGGIASKYTGLLACAPLGVMPLLLWRHDSWAERMRRLAAIAAALLLAGAVFFLLAPYSWWRFDRFVAGFAAESTHAASGHHGVKILPWHNLWMFHLSRSLIPGVHAVPLFAAVAAAGLLLIRRRQNELLLLGTAGIFYLVAELSPTKPFPQPERYVIPCVPFIALLLAVFVERFRSNNARTVVALSLFMMPLSRTVDLASEIRPDTRQTMRAWMVEHLPQGSKVLTTGGSVYLPRFPPGKFRVAAHGKVLRKKQDFIAGLRGSGYSYLLVARFDAPFLRGVKDETDLKNEALGVVPPPTTIERVKNAFPVVKEVRSVHGSYGFHNPVLTLYDLRVPTPLPLNESEKFDEESSGNHDSASPDGGAAQIRGQG